MRHLIDPLDFTLEETTKVLDLADRIAESPEVYSHVADGKKIATLFYEPYCPGGKLLCRYHCNAASQGRRSPSRFHVCHSAGNQCRGWRT